MFYANLQNKKAPPVGDAFKCSCKKKHRFLGGALNIMLGV